MNTTPTNKPVQNTGNSTGCFTLVYILTDACNFRCTYCYENINDSPLSNKPFQNHSFQLQNMLITYRAFCRHFNSIPGKIVFFGGEPLLQKKLIVSFIETLKAENNLLPLFSTITNASLLDSEFQEYIAKNFSEITFSIDGAREIHDRYRVDHNGAGTFDKVIQHIREFQDRNEHTTVAVEATLTDAYTRGASPALCKETWDLFRSLSLQTIDYIPVQGGKYSLFQENEDKKILSAKTITDYLVDLWFDDLINLCLITDVMSFHNLLLSMELLKNKYLIY